MAARNPSSFDVIDDTQFLPGEPILSVPMDELYNNMEYFLDAEHMTLVDHITQVTFNPVNTNFVEVGVWAGVVTKDMCDLDGIVGSDGIPQSWSALVWTSGSTTGEVKITGTAAVNGTETLTIPNTVTPTWIALGTSFNVVTNGLEDRFVVQIRTLTVGQAVFFAGIAVFADET